MAKSYYSGTTVLDFIVAMKMSFLQGNVVKYVSRAGLKPGVNASEDLKKARDYLDVLIFQAEIAEEDTEVHGVAV